MSPWKEEKYISPETLAEKILELRQEGKTIATLNGSFDLLHAGHLKMIHEASQQADVLLLALNSDSSIQKYKSPLRPIVPLENRLEMVAALQFVDYVTYFNETDPIAFHRNCLCVFMQKHIYIYIYQACTRIESNRFLSAI